MTKRREPYQRGRDAALRVGEYERCHSQPRCPYEAGSAEAELWHGGFGDATDEAIHWSLIA